MKKTYLITSLLGLTSLTFSQAQLPNSSFDNWEDIPYESISYESPNSWNPGSICASVSLGDGGTEKCSVASTKSSDSNTGDFAAKIVDDGAFGLNLLDYSFTDAPTSMELKVKKSLLVGDSAEVKIFLHKGSVFNDNVIGEGIVKLGGISSVYETINVSIDYSGDKLLIDSMSVIISVSEDGETTNSSILVDDIKLVYGAVGLAEKSTVKTISINPNPASNVVNFNEELAQFDILSLDGEVVVTGIKVESVDISALNKGMYILKGTDSNGELVASRFVKR